MLHNYLTVGIRALTKNRAYAVINIVGLAIGMAACLLILLFVRDQLSYDRFFPDADRLYQFQAVSTNPDTGAVDRTQSTPWTAGQALIKDFPQVEHVAYLSNQQPIMMDKGMPRPLGLTLVGSDFLRMFRLDFIAGRAETALPDVNAIALSERKAVALFGTTNAVGRTVTTLNGSSQRSYRVTAVFRDLPRNSHLGFEALALHDRSALYGDELTGWGQFNGYNYVELRPGADPAQIDAQLEAWKNRNAPKRAQNGKLVSDVDSVRFKLVPLVDVHLGDARGGPTGNEGDRATVTTFSVLAVLILVMACVNFTNLATARASQRAREVALRKVLGASRGQLIVQFLGESVLVTAIAMLISLAIVELCLPWLRSFLDAGIPLHYFGRDGVLPPAVGLTLLVGIVSGIYPAFYLTRFEPARVLKANRSAEAAGSGRLRGALVVLQFAISIGLIVCTAVVYAQTVYARTVDPGFRRQGLLQIENVSRSQVKSNIRAVMQEIGRTPGVRSVALAQLAVNTDSRSNDFVYLPGRQKPLTLGFYDVGYGYIETMGMKLLAGRTLSEDHALDDIGLGDQDADADEQALVARGVNIMVNQSATRQMGFATPEDAIGKQVRVDFIRPENGGLVPATIVGVVGDTRFRSPHEQVDPMIFYHDQSDFLQYLVARVDTLDAAAVRDRIAAVWRRMVPTVPFAASFSEDEARDLTATEAAMAEMFSAFALLSVIVGCLGLFGLAAFTAERRTKEIGIRKVLGARTGDIVRLLVWQFSRPVLIANLIAWPVAWWVMRDWLNRFDERITLGPAPFLLAGGLALAIAIATIASHAFRVARANPIAALRYE